MDKEFLKKAFPQQFEKDEKEIIEELEKIGVKPQQTENSKQQSN